MIIIHEREKLIQAINFFVRNTRKCGKVKLYKLLYFLDFEHFNATGRSVTGLTYNAWPKGPVPVSLHDEIDKPAKDMLEVLDFGKRTVGDGWMLAISPKAEFDDSKFSKRETTLLKNLAAEYKSKDADSMIEATHLENLPWDQIYNQQGRKQAEIPYSLAPRPDESDTIMRIAADRKELLEKLK